MRINADFSRPAAVVPSADAWALSPETGVERLMLDRVGDEVARATSLVRYAPGSRFPRHEHALGEEFLVLEGVFSDESGDYPAGSYVRNPPGSSHAPHSDPGCRIFVKLRQFHPDDGARVAIDTRDPALWERDPGEAVLHTFDSERVVMRRLAAGAALAVGPDDAGTEILVVEGRLRDPAGEFPAESWLRYPAGCRSQLIAAEPSLVWIKTGHLEPGAG